MDYPKCIVSNQKEEFISIQRVKSGTFYLPVFQLLPPSIILRRSRSSSASPVVLNLSPQTVFKQLLINIFDLNLGRRWLSLSPLLVNCTFLRRVLKQYLLSHHSLYQGCNILSFLAWQKVSTLDYKIESSLYKNQQNGMWAL